MFKTKIQKKKKNKTENPSQKIIKTNISDYTIIQN